jgi:hypothetical protein
MTDEAAERMSNYFWHDGKQPDWDGEKWQNGRPQMVPTCSNQEGIGYLPEHVPFEEKGGRDKTFHYEEIYNREYKGHVGMQDDAMIHPLWMSVWWTATDMAELEGFDGTGGRLTKNDIDKIIDYSIPYANEGHFRAFATDFGGMVTAFSTREIYLMQCWNPVTQATRRSMIPCYWAQTTHGGMLWFSGDSLSAQIQPGSQAWDECLQFMDWRTQPYWVNFILRNGYQCPRWNTQDVKDEMGPELWDWQYGGLETYKDLDGCMRDVWPDDDTYWGAEDKLRNALFIPELYNWSSEKGTPNTGGALKDHGSSTENFGNLGGCEEFPPIFDYSVERWTYLKSLIA